MLSERQRLEALYAIAESLRRKEATAQVILQNALSMTAAVLGVQHGGVVTFRKDDKTNDIFVLGGKAGGDREQRRELWDRLITQA